MQQHLVATAIAITGITQSASGISISISINNQHKDKPYLKKN
jgi:hypothetical protein